MHHGCSCLFYAKLVNRFTKESNPEPSLLTLWDTGKWQTRASLSMLMDQIDEKRTKPTITSQFHSFGSTGVHREVCSTKAKQRWWMVPFIHSFNCSPLTGSGSLHFPRHNCWLLNWFVTWVFTFAEPRSLLPDDTNHDYFSWMAVVCIIILKRTGGRGFAQKLYRVVNFWLKTWLFLSCECVAYLLCIPRVHQATLRHQLKRIVVQAQIIIIRCRPKKQANHSSSVYTWSLYPACWLPLPAFPFVIRKCNIDSCSKCSRLFTRALPTLLSWHLAWDQRRSTGTFLVHRKTECWVTMMMITKRRTKEPAVFILTLVSWPLVTWKEHCITIWVHRYMVELPKT